MQSEESRAPKATYPNKGSRQAISRELPWMRLRRGIEMINWAADESGSGFIVNVARRSDATWWNVVCNLFFSNLITCTAGIKINKREGFAT